MRAKRNKSDTNGNQHIFALVNKDTYDFVRGYSVFSLGFSLDLLVEDFKKLRAKILQQAPDKIQ